MFLQDLPVIAKHSKQPKRPSPVVQWCNEKARQTPTTRMNFTHMTCNRSQRPKTTCHVIQFKYNWVTQCKVITASEGMAGVTFRAKGKMSDQDQAWRISWHAGNVLFLEPGAVSWVSTCNNSLGMKFMFCAHFRVFVTLQ